MNPRRQFGGERLKCLAARSRQADRCAARVQGPGNGAADAAGRAGNKRGLSTEVKQGNS